MLDAKKIASTCCYVHPQLGSRCASCVLIAAVQAEQVRSELIAERRVHFVYYSEHTTPRTNSNLVQLLVRVHVPVKYDTNDSTTFRILCRHIRARITP